MRKLTLLVAVAFVVAFPRSAAPADPLTSAPVPAPVIFVTWGGCDYTFWIGGWVRLSDPTPSPSPPLIYIPPYISSQFKFETPPTMTLDTNDPPTLTLDTDKPDPNDKPPDPPKPPDPGSDVVPVVGDLGGPADGSTPKNPPAQGDNNIGMNFNGSEPGQTVAIAGPEHQIPWSGPGKLDGGYASGFAGCTTGPDRTCSFKIAPSELGTYNFGKFKPASMTLSLAHYPAAPPAGEDACRSKQRSARNGTRARSAPDNAHRIIGDELPVAFIRLRDAR